MKKQYKYAVGVGDNPDGRHGFTLAETLIVLGIIGVVSALTLPSLIAKYKHKELETRFKKSYSIISQASQGLEQELGSCERDRAENINQYMLNSLKVLKTGTFAKRELGYQFKTYDLTPTNAVIHPNCLGGDAGQIPYLYMVTPEGTTLALCTNRSYATMISVDTNGVNKGPNAYGHDLFFFYFDKENCKLKPFDAQWRTCTDTDDGCAGASDSGYGFKWTDGSCSRNSKNSENGFVCTKYALENKCPDDVEKSYWDCLP